MSNFKTKMKENQNLGTILALIILMVFVSILNPAFLQSNNLLNLMRQLIINGFIALGMTFVILTGGIDLSVGSTLALTSAIFAGLLQNGMNTGLAILIALVLGLVLGLLNGILITKGKLAPFIVTLATMTIFRGLTLVYTDGRPIAGPRDDFAFKFLGKGQFLGIPFQVILFILAFLVLWMILNKTALGRKIYAVGGNEKASFISGINIDKVKIWVYVISSLMAVLSGLVLTSRLNSAQPTAGAAYEMDAIAAVVLGGTSMTGGSGSLTGTLIGILILGVLNNGLNLLGVSSFYQQIVKGIVILIAVLIDRKRNK
ncbi:Ribose transport system permease protein rbsC [Anaerococcus octavius]|uniref:Ribose transport system permease protein rbsC n=1 Tax=Anaerococcus octavius TaxID=54007 RepID=A0A380WWD2_9FIRM|nr:MULTISPECIES: ribose ABC transporter permease [Anaerococcus]MDU4025201.1 ribose ABC transporter permease [Anaerococcus sp.]MDU5228914.1 ribose ABC transporter permease [Anaerococcus sp.]SUU93109.1 Ribose transport system permease protein rbsC [Anaerococcus octavius]